MFSTSNENPIPEDAETGLYYAQARYYDPEIARFASADPLQYRPAELMKRFRTDPQALNYYAYAGNNPIKLVDPTGESYAATMGGSTSPLILADGPLSVGDAIVVGATLLGGLVDLYLWLTTETDIDSSSVEEEISKASSSSISDSTSDSDVTVQSSSASSPNTPDLDPEEEKRLKSKLGSIQDKYSNISKHHLKIDDIQGAVRDLKNNPVTKNGRTYDHLNEVKEALKGLEKNVIKPLQKFLSNDSLPDTIRQSATNTLKQAKDLSSSVRKIISQ